MKPLVRTLALVIAFVLEAATLLLLLWERSLAAWLVSMLTHVGAAAGAAVGLGRRRDEAFLAGALVLALPGAALVGLGLTRLGEALVPPEPPAEGDHASLDSLPSPEQPPESLDTVFDWLQTQLDVRPLGDVLRWGEPGAQQWAIQMLAKREDGESVDLLRQALTSTDRGLQMAASSAIQRIEERLTERIRLARERTQRNPDLAPAFRELAEACRAYCQSRLLDPIMERHWLDEAEAAYRRALTLDPMSAPARMRLAGILAARGEVREAEPHVRAVLRLEPSAEADVLLAEILAAQRRWPQVAEVFKAARAEGREGSDLARWWATAREEDQHA